MDASPAQGSCEAHARRAEESTLDGSTTTCNAAGDRNPLRSEGYGGVGPFAALPLPDHAHASPTDPRLAYGTHGARNGAALPYSDSLLVQGVGGGAEETARAGRQEHPSLVIGKPPADENPFHAPLHLLSGKG